MKIVILDAKTLGADVCLNEISKLGEVVLYENSTEDEVAERIKDADAVVLNKAVITEKNIQKAEKLKVISICATGYDNVDLECCRKKNIAVCNVPGYSTDSVAQYTVAAVLTCALSFPEYIRYVRDGSYTHCKIQNKLTPITHEINNMTWGIVGYGAIGQKTAEIARAIGCRVIYTRKRPSGDPDQVSLDYLCRNADIITVHAPLNSETFRLIGKKEIELMKNGVIIVNSARGAILDEQAIADAVENGKIGAFACDPYSVEPFPESHPFWKIKELPNVYLTPHMAWGTSEARHRLITSVADNIRAFFAGERRNRVD